MVGDCVDAGIGYVRCYDERLPRLLLPDGDVEHYPIGDARCRHLIDVTYYTFVDIVYLMFCWQVFVLLAVARILLVLVTLLTPLPFVLTLLFDGITTFIAVTRYCWLLAVVWLPDICYSLVLLRWQRYIDSLCRWATDPLRCDQVNVLLHYTDVIVVFSGRCHCLTVLRWR